MPIGTITSLLSGLPVSLPGTSSVSTGTPGLSTVTDLLTGATNPAPAVGSSDGGSVGSTDSSSGGSGFTTAADSSTFPQTASAGSFADGGSLPFTGEPTWIRIAGAIALAMALIIGLVSLSMRFAARRTA